MVFSPKTWIGRDVEHPGRIILTPTGNPNEYDVQRSEGNINVAGDLISPENLNSLEQRIASLFSSNPWTPTLYGSTTAGAPTYTSRSGNYYMVENLMFFKGSVGISSKGGMAGTVRVGGLPFTCSGGICQFIYSYGFNISSGFPYGGYVGANYVDFYKTTSSAISDINASEIADSALFQICGVAEIV